MFLRNGFKKLGFDIIAQNPANCVSAFYTGKYDASQIVKIMREKYNIEIAPSGGDLKTKCIRVGNYGNIGIKEIKKCLKSFEKTLKELK